MLTPAPEITLTPLVLAQDSTNPLAALQHSFNQISAAIT